MGFKIKFLLLIVCFGVLSGCEFLRINRNGMPETQNIQESVLEEPPHPKPFTPSQPEGGITADEAEALEPLVADSDAEVLTDGVAGIETTCAADAVVTREKYQGLKIFLSCLDALGLKEGQICYRNFADSEVIKLSLLSQKLFSCVDSSHVYLAVTPAKF